MLRHRLLIAVGAGIVLTAIPGSPPVRAADAGATNIAIRPEYAGSTTLAHGHFRFDVTPGVSVEDAIVVQNLGTQPVTVNVYPADTTQDPGHGLAPAPEGAAMHSVGLWIKVQSMTLTLAPKAQATDHFDVTIPLGTEPGDHIGAIVAQVTGKGQASGGVGFGVVAREALLVEANVPGRTSPSATVSSLAGEFDNATDSYHFRVSLNNTGNLLLNVNGDLIITDDSGKQVGSLQLQPYGAYAIPGGTLTVQTGGWTFGPGTYHVQARLNVLADDKPFTSVSSNSLTYSFTNWMGVIGLAAGAAALLAVAGFGVSFLRRPRSGGRPRRSTSAHR